MWKTPHQRSSLELAHAPQAPVSRRALADGWGISASRHRLVPWQQSCPSAQTCGQRGQGTQLQLLFRTNTPQGAALTHRFAKSTPPGFCSLIWSPFTVTVPDLELIEMSQVRELPQTGFQVEEVQVHLICEMFGRRK